MIYFLMTSLLLGVGHLVEAMPRGTEPADRGIRIRQLDILNHRVSVVSPKGTQLRNGDRLIAVNKKGRSCTLLVTSVISRRAILSTRSCATAGDLYVGEKLSRSEFKIRKTTSYDSSLPRPLRSQTKGKLNWADFRAPDVFVYYSAASQTNLEVAGRRTSLGTGGAFGLGGAFGFGARYREVRNRELGWSAGISYELARTVLNSDYFDSDPTFSLLILEPNFTLGWDQVYFLGGINISIPLTSTSGITMGGSLGLQGGGGVELANNITLEALYRTLNLNINSTQRSTPQLDKGRLWGLLVRGVYSFN